MGDKVFSNNIRLKYNYDRDKVGNTVFRPYVYDSSGTKDTFSPQFNYTNMVHPLNTPENGGDGYKLRFDITHQDNAHGGKRRYLFFKDTKGVNSMFSASDNNMVNDVRINQDFSISMQAKNLNDFIITKHDLRFDKGTLKYVDKGRIYTVEGLGSFSNEVDNSLRRQFYGYGQPVKYNYSNSGSIISDIADGTNKFTNGGYSCFMLLVHFSVRLFNDNGASDNFTMYCFVPVCFYDLSILNNKADSNAWSVRTELLGHASSKPYSTLFYITNSYNGVGSDADKRIWGYNGVNVSRGKVKDPSARNIPDVYWETPCGSSGTHGNFISDSIINQYKKMGDNFKYRTMIEITSYHMSEMSYKYYMYGDGQNQWRGKTLSMSKYMVKWYPTMSTINNNPNYFLMQDYGYIY